MRVFAAIIVAVAFAIAGVMLAGIAVCVVGLLLAASGTPLGPGPEKLMIPGLALAALAGIGGAYLGAWLVLRDSNRRR